MVEYVPANNLIALALHLQAANRPSNREGMQLPFEADFGDLGVGLFASFVPTFAVTSKHFCGTVHEKLWRQVGDALSEQARDLRCLSWEAVRSECLIHNWLREIVLEQRPLL